MLQGILIDGDITMGGSGKNNYFYQRYELDGVFKKECPQCWKSLQRSFWEEGKL